MSGIVILRGILTFGLLHGANTSHAPVQVDTVGTLMVPTQDLEQHISDLESLGVAIDSTHQFKDLRCEDAQTCGEQIHQQ